MSGERIEVDYNTLIYLRCIVEKLKQTVLAGRIYNDFLTMTLILERETE